MATITLTVQTDDLTDTAGYRIGAVNDARVLSTLRTALTYYAELQESKAERAYDEDDFGDSDAQFAREYSRTAAITRAILTAVN